MQLNALFNTACRKLHRFNWCFRFRKKHTIEKKSFTLCKTTAL